ncbi:MAG: hypothetical protein JWQ34_2912 [Mucilaginibacter sp.]|nr:hypothetical protein [Mucilaginibacter sp.]
MVLMSSLCSVKDWAWRVECQAFFYALCMGNLVCSCTEMCFILNFNIVPLNRRGLAVTFVLIPKTKRSDLMNTYKNKQ